MDRIEFERLATERRLDAAALLNAGRYGGAYYIAGYVVECALKACIARKTRQDEFPPKDAAKYYTHDLTRLLEVADLGAAFAEETERDSAFKTNWALVKDWNEETRYQSRGQRQAEEILLALDDPDHGVLQWLKQNW